MEVSVGLNLYVVHVIVNLLRLGHKNFRESPPPPQYYNSLYYSLDQFILIHITCFPYIHF